MNKKQDLIDPPKRVSEKVPPFGGPTPEAAIRKALNLSAELMDSYEGWAVDDLQMLWLEHENLPKGQDVPKERINKIFDIAHETRGQGGSFGYPLVSLIADSLCKFVERKGALNSEQLNIVQLHLLALKAVLRQKLKGNQPEMGGELTKLLQAIRES